MGSLGSNCDAVLGGMGSKCDAVLGGMGSKCDAVLGGMGSKCDAVRMGMGSKCDAVRMGMGSKCDAVLMGRRGSYCPGKSEEVDRRGLLGAALLRGTDMRRDREPACTYMCSGDAVTGQNLYAFFGFFRPASRWPLVWLP